MEAPIFWFQPLIFSGVTFFFLGGETIVLFGDSEIAHFEFHSSQTRISSDVESITSEIPNDKLDLPPTQDASGK